MDVQNRTCPEYVKVKVAVLNSPCWAVKRKQVINDQANQLVKPKLAVLVLPIIIYT